jgi:hypothetical protein
MSNLGLWSPPYVAPQGSKLVSGIFYVRRWRWMHGKRDSPNFWWVIGRSCQSTKWLLIMKCCGCQKSNCHQKRESRRKKKQSKKNTDAHSQGTYADPNRIRAAWSSDLHQICHSNNSQNKHTHTLWSFNRKWFTHTWINTSDHRMQILVPYIGLNNPGTISCLICNAHHHKSISGFNYGLWSQFSLCSLGPLSH